MTTFGFPFFGTNFSLTSVSPPSSMFTSSLNTAFSSSFRAFNPAASSWMFTCFTMFFFICTTYCTLTSACRSALVTSLRHASMTSSSTTVCSPSLRSAPARAEPSSPSTIVD